MAQDRSDSRHGKTHDASDRGGKLQNLQILRAVAALSVVLAHSLHEVEGLGVGQGAAIGFGRFLNLGYGVDMFFVISGFIMLHTSLNQFGVAGAPAKFFLRRLARIAPLYWLLTTLMIAGALAAPWLLNVPLGDLRHTAASYLFVPDARGAGEVRPVMALGWTLNYEMMFYVLFAVALLAPARRAIFGLTATMAALALYGVVAAPSDLRVAFWTSPIILEFLLGVYVALAYNRGVRIGARAAAMLLGLGLTGYLVSDVLVTQHALLRLACAGLPAAGMVLALTCGPAVRTGRLTALGVALGDASYSLYLSHPFLLRPLRVIWAKLVGPHLSPGWFVAACLIASALAALGVYRWVERPLTRLAQNALVGRRRAAAPQLAARMAFATRRTA